MISTFKAYQDSVVDSKALRGRSKAEYLRQVRKLGARYPGRSLKQIGERMVFDHLIYLRDKEKLRPSTVTQGVVALRMFYRDYLQREWKLWKQFTRRDCSRRIIASKRSTRFIGARPELGVVPSAGREPEDSRASFRMHRTTTSSR